MAKEGESPMISLKTADDVVFEVDLAIAREMNTVQSFIEADGGANTSSAPIPLPNVFKNQLSLIIDYLDHHRLGEAKEFDVEFTKDLNFVELRELLLAVNYLDVKCLLDFLTQAIADRIQNKGVKFARWFFGIETDYTPGEEAKFREENAWAFRGIDEDDDEYDN